MIGLSRLAEYEKEGLVVTFGHPNRRAACTSWPPVSWLATSLQATCPCGHRLAARRARHADGL